MQAKRHRHTIDTGMKKLFIQVVQQCRQEISKKEEEHNQTLRETEASALKKAEEDTRVRDREHQLVVQEKELKIRELELAAKQQGDSTVREVIPTDILKPEHIDNLHWSTMGGNLVDGSRRWRDIGSQLGFSVEEMAIIYLENFHDENQCLYKLLYQWLH